MFLPPADALLPRVSGSRVTDEAEVESGHRYEDYRAQERKYAAAVTSPVSSDAAHSLPTACGHAHTPVASSSRGSSHDHHTVSVAAMTTYSHLVGNDLCSGDDGTGVMCWTQCYSVASLPCGTSAECVDTATGEVVDGTAMCPSDHENCELQCVADPSDPTSSNSTSDKYDSYCWGDGVTMYMSGFQSLASSKDGATECLNLFFEEWTLDNDSRFAVACFGIFFLGLIIELLVLCRRLLFERYSKSFWRDVGMVILHGVNVVLSYFIMLVAMTYNVELFSMAVTGLTVGYMFFNLTEPPRHTTDPCCSLGHENENEKRATHNI